MTKKELFNELYQQYLYLKKNERRDKLIAALRPYFKSDQAVKNYVDSNIERKRRNLICRRIRLTTCLILWLNLMLKVPQNGVKSKQVKKSATTDTFD